MKNRYRIPRRSFLRGSGVCMAIPALEIMSTPTVATEASSQRIPLRLGVFHKGNGIDPRAWQVEGTQDDFALSENLEPLTAVKDDIIVLSNVSNQPKGDHYGAMPLFMTGIQNRNPKYTFDQVIADHIGTSTAFKSFQLSAEPVDIRSTTLNSLSYDQLGRAKFVERNAQFAFDRLFRGMSSTGVREEMTSVLDAVREPTADLMKRASRLDRVVISNYLDSVREVEVAIERHERLSEVQGKPREVSDEVIQLGSFPAKMKTMTDLVALAFWTDATRVASCIMALESSRRIHDFLNLKADFHWSSHFERNEDLAAQFNTANTWYVEQFRLAIEKMKSLKEYDGSSVFDHCVLMFGSGLSHGGQHVGSNLPLVLAGGKSSGLNTGKFLDYPNQPPHANCLLTLIQHFGVELEQYSNSSGTLANLRKV